MSENAARKIWVDADACPKVIKDILFRAAERVKIPIVLVSNLYLRVPPSDFISAIQVPGGFDVADDYIVAQVQPGELVITADIPLVKQIIEKNALALSPHGKLFTQGNVNDALLMRNMKEELRMSGVDTGSPQPFSMSDREAFANRLDSILRGWQGNNR